MSIGGGATVLETIRDSVWRRARYCPRCGHDHFTIKEHYLYHCDMFVIECWNCGRFEIEPAALSVFLAKKD